MKNFTNYYRLCNERLKEEEHIQEYLFINGITLETAEKYNIGFDPDADPAADPGSLYIGPGENKKYLAQSIIYPCTDEFYICESIDPETPSAFRILKPKGKKTKLFNSNALSDDNGIIFITEYPLKALQLIEAGQSAIAYNGSVTVLEDYLKNNPINKQFIIDYDKYDDEAKKTAEKLKQSLIKQNIKCITYNVIENGAIANPALFEEKIKAAIKELTTDDLEKFLDKVTTEAYKPICTGLNFFDNLLGGGIIPQSLLMLIAAPGAGKTTLIQQVAEEMAKNKKPVIYLNFEMSREQMLAKAISAKYYKGNGGMKTTPDILQGYKWSDKEKEKIEKIINDYRVNNYPYIKYNPEGSTNELNGLLSFLEAIGRKAEAENKPGPAVVIDYIHFIQSEDNLDPAELIKEAVKGLKDYAIKYNTFVIGIIAANREGNKKGQLTMNSGRDSSNLEYTADYQLSLQYEQVDDGTIDPNDEKAMAPLKRAEEKKMIIRVLKNRFFGSGAYRKVIFKSKYNIFDDGNARQY